MATQSGATRLSFYRGTCFTQHIEDHAEDKVNFHETFLESPEFRNPGRDRCIAPGLRYITPIGATVPRGGPRRSDPITGTADTDPGATHCHGNAGVGRHGYIRTTDRHGNTGVGNRYTGATNSDPGPGNSDPGPGNSDPGPGNSDPGPG